VSVNNHSWFVEYIGELTSWTGHEDETADQVDVSSMAALHWFRGSSGGGGVVVMDVSASRDGAKEDNLKWGSMVPQGSRATWPSVWSRHLWTGR
jgi:hypothetical protein